MENNKIKNIVIVSFLVFLAIIITYSILWGPAKKFSDSLITARTITISAEGKVVAKPDIAKFSFSVVSEGEDPQKIAEENNIKINKAIDFVKAQNIDEKDIKTTQYNLSPRYEYDKIARKSYISGYTLTQTVSVKIRDFNIIGKVINGLPELGINQMDAISFDIDEPEKYLAEARNEAFKKAKAKAQEMAFQNGVKLGKVVTFYEYQNSPLYYNRNYFGKGESSIIPMSVESLPSIQPGSQEVTVNVSVVYKLK